MMRVDVVYGPGGFDPSKPNSNVIEKVELPDSPPTPEEQALASAIAKLTALGLTEAEALALIGG